MDDSAHILVHPSRFPGEQAKLWFTALAENRIPSSFLYEGPAQMAHWLALHNEFSPAKTDSDCQELYRAAFTEALKHLKGPVVHLAAICAGDAGKDAGLIELLRSNGKVALFTAADTSLELLLSARAKISERFKGLQSSSIMLDVEGCSTLPALLKAIDPMASQRIITFFGTIHNFSTTKALSQVIKAVRSDDLFLLSANLAPAKDYHEALAKILEGYDNPLSRRWFWGALNNLGLFATDGELVIGIEGSPTREPLKRIEASFKFARAKTIEVFGRSFQYNPGDRLQVFISWRFTSDAVRSMLQEQALTLLGTWETENEGVYLCRR
ncbi:MAG: L-histidine N(alpha)-methyltransferase [Verrucomicrobiales bacterium]